MDGNNQGANETKIFKKQKSTNYKKLLFLLLLKLRSD